MDYVQSTALYAWEYVQSILGGNSEEEDPEEEEEDRDEEEENENGQAREDNENRPRRKTPKHFDPDYMNDLFLSSLQQDNRVNAAEFILACKQVPKLMSGMGRTLKLGNSKLNEKIRWMEQRMGETAKALDVPQTQVSLQDMIERDIENGWTHTGKPTNHATRNIVRMVWFIDFINALYLGVSRDTQNGSLRKVLLEVYKNSLGLHHPVAVRKVTETGLKLGSIPTRKEFVKHFGFADLSIEAQNEKLKNWSKAMEDLSEVMWEYIDSKNLRDVP